MSSLDAAQPPSRYLLQIQQRYHVLDLQPGRVSHTLLTDLASLLEHLGEEQPHYSALHLDKHALEGHDLALILPSGGPTACKCSTAWMASRPNSACWMNTMRCGASACRSTTNRTC